MTALILVTLLSAAPDDVDVYQLDPTAFIETAQHDLETLHRFVDGMHGVLEGVQQRRALFGRHRDVYSPDEKQALLSTWGALFSYFSATEGLRQKYWHFLEHPPTDPRHHWGFLVTHTALAALLSSGLTFAQLTLNDPQLETLFDEPNPLFGVPAGAFAAFKLRAIHVGTATQLVTGDNYGLASIPWLKRQPGGDGPAVRWALGELKSDAKAARRALTRHGVRLFLGNAKDLVADGSMHALFPAQKSFAEWLGDTRVARVGKPLLTPKDVETRVLPRLQPGDVLVTRQNWFLSNIGLPGFWPHALLYVGAATDLKQAFDADPAVLAWVRAQPERAQTFSALLAARYPAKWKTYEHGEDFQGHAPIRVIESISEGVSFTASEHAFGVDYLAALRPRLPASEKARAIERAFHYQGRPYDFDFDFFSDAALVCTELVYKSYQPGADLKGLSLDLVDVAGRRTLPANEIVKRFDSDATRGAPQLDFVFFLDGREQEGTVVDADERAFRASWERVKWDLAQD